MSRELQDSLIKTHRHLLAGICLVSVVVLSATAYATGALSQGFKTNSDNLPAGSLVSLHSGSQDVVEPAASANAAQLVGVIADKPLIELDSKTNQVQAVVSGVTPTLVSDINGVVKPGDRITASPISGVGMKAEASTQVIGTAESTLADSVTKTYDIKDKTGKTKAVHVGTIPVLVGISYYVAPQDRLSSFVPSFLVSFANNIAGKEVSALRVLISFLLLFIGFVIVGVMLQAGIRSGIISLGRNPLAHDILRRSMLDVLLTSFGVLVLSIVVFYLILTI